MSPDKAPTLLNKPVAARRIKLMFFVTSLESGGTERQLLLLLKHLPSTEFEKHLVCLSGYGILEEEARKSSDFLYDLAYPRIRIQGKLQWQRLHHLLTPVPKLALLLKKIRPDVFHTLIPICNVMGAVAAKLAGTPNLISSRLSLGNYRDRNKIFARLEDLSDPQFKIIHCKSRGISQDVLNREPVIPSQIRVVYNGLDTSRFQLVNPANRKLARSRLNLPESAAIIGMVANLWDYKGHLDVVRALPALLEEVPSTMAVFIGRDSGMAEAIQSEAKALKVDSRVILAGEQSGISELLPAFDLLVSASHEEGFSNVILEAMAAGLPVVATDVGGNPEQVVHQETGLLVPPHSSVGLAEAISRILKDPDLATAYGTAGHRRVQALFSVEAMVAGMTSMYRELVNITKECDS